jgi:beta-glucosidase
VRKLVQFDRVTLRPGHAAWLNLHVGERQLSYWSTDDQGWVRGSGHRSLDVGSSSRDLRLHTSVDV